MRTHVLASASAVALFLSAQAQDLEPAQWQVTSLSSYSPAGGQSQWLIDYYFIELNITNPHDGVVVSCTTTWKDSDVPYGKITDCQGGGDTTATWTLEPLEFPHFGTTDMYLRWRAAAAPSSSDGTMHSSVLIGVAHFEVGDNMTGQCAARGFCNWYLKSESTPVSVDVKAVLCQGTVEEAVHDLNCV
ncbi:hypothetical protein F5Y17DRAFT_416943 [Xylariaceae sp. FL0594]|nr:hypothetical protein F5Y17DRAFT_416943 [Xylariaceae sp. FL0594]